MRRTPRASGRINRLVVSIKISAGIRGVGVPSGSKWAREADGLFRSPVSRVASQRGKAKAMLMDSWVVGVNVYGRSPRRLIVRSMVISDVNIRAHLWPLLLSGAISCFVIRCRSHVWMVDSRLLTHRLSREGNSRAGKSRDSRTRGTPNRQGLENWSKKLRFMVRLMVWAWW